jgi:cytochrome P450
VRNSALIKDSRMLGLSGDGSDGAFLEAMGGMFAFMPPPRHTELRSLVNRGFTPRSVRQLEPHIEQVVRELIDAVIDRGEMDLVRDYAYRIPVTIICELLGVPLAAEAFFALIQSLIDDRRSAARDDLISRLVAIQQETSALSDKDIISTALLLFQAGHETTANMIAKGALALVRHPDELARLHAHPELTRNAVEELLRYDTPVQMTTKWAADDIPFHDRVIRKDDTVIFFWGAVNRDPARYLEPDRLDITRSDVDHHSFGMGAHFCLGASLARLELRHAFGAIGQRLPGLKLAGEPVYKGQLHVHGLASLPVRW